MNFDLIYFIISFTYWGGVRLVRVGWGWGHMVGVRLCSAELGFVGWVEVGVGVGVGIKLELGNLWL